MRGVLNPVVDTPTETEGARVEHRNPQLLICIGHIELKSFRVAPDCQRLDQSTRNREQCKPQRSTQRRHTESSLITFLAA